MQQMKSLLMQMESPEIVTALNSYKLTKAEEDMSDTEWLVYRDNQQLGNLHLSDNLDCPKCLNKGWVYSYQNKNGIETTSTMQCECMKSRQAIINAKHSGMGELLDYRLSQYQIPEEWQKDIRETAKRYILDKSNKWFSILGQSGIGKSMICSAICNQRLKEYHQVKYMIWNEFIDKLKRMKYDSDRDEFFNEFAKAEILYIDDLFKGKVSEADVNYAFQLINERYNNKAITIISSELTIGDLADIDEAIAGRIKERSGAYCIQVKKDTSKNYRLK